MAASGTDVEYNTRNPSVRRLLQEAKELRISTDQYWAKPLDTNLFEWHFTIRGPSSSDFDGGFYHGRILLPPAPSFILLTPNGRFELNRKICLSISGHHPETWQPSWSIRTALLALIAFLPTASGGALGSLDYPAEERRRLASLSKKYCCPECGLVIEHLLKTDSAATVSDDIPNETPRQESMPNTNDASVSASRATEPQSTVRTTATDHTVPSEDAPLPNPHVFPVFTSTLFNEQSLNPSNLTAETMLAYPPPIVAAAYLPWMYSAMSYYAWWHAFQMASAMAASAPIAPSFGTTDPARPHQLLARRRMSRGVFILILILSWVFFWFIVPFLDAILDQ